MPSRGRSYSKKSRGKSKPRRGGVTKGKLRAGASKPKGKYFQGGGKF